MPPKAEARNLQFVMTPVDKLVPYVNNPRTHSPDQIAQIMASIREFGFLNPVIVDGDNGIIAGHGRVLAASKLGITEVPTVEAKWLTEAQRKAYIISDNKIAINAGWDEELLRLEIEALQAMDFNVELTGFSVDEIDAILAKGNPGNTDPDDVPELQERAVSVLGDVWVMDKHRLVCGDSTSAEISAKALNGVKPHLMVTDPPYGVEYDPSWRLGPLHNKSTQANQKVANDDVADWRAAWALFPGDVMYIWHASMKFSEVEASVLSVDFHPRSVIIWDKGHFVPSRCDYHWQHEPCLYAIRKGKTGHWQGARTFGTVWQIARNSRNETKHATQNPVECMKRPIENNSSPGQAVYEPFSGSGTTLIACEMTGRCCHAIELDPQWVDVAVRRWQDFAGGTAVLEATGETFDQVAKGRLGAQAVEPAPVE